MQKVKDLSDMKRRSFVWYVIFPLLAVDEEPPIDIYAIGFEEMVDLDAKVG